MAANTVFIIFDTQGTPVAAIEPNTLNGPGGVAQNSDLSLFGLGYATWGQAADQNDYKLLENFACPQSVLNPSPVQPMGAAELGTGNGINFPVLGQLWFNVTTNQLYVYTEPSPDTFAWATVSNPVITVTSGTSPPLPASAGQMFYNTNFWPSNPPGQKGQLMVYDAVSGWISAALQYLPLSGNATAPMTGILYMGQTAGTMYNIRNLANPTLPYDAVNLQYMQSAIAGIGAGVFVPLAGGTMTGQLTMSSANIVLNNGSVTTNTGNVTLNTGTLTINSPPSGIAMTANGRILNVTTSAGTDAASSNYGDGRWLIKATGSSQSVTGPVAFSNTVTAPTAATGTNTTQIATTAFVHAVTNPGSSLTANGYQKFDSGLILQWGSFFYDGGSTFTITFPTAFASACFSVTSSQPADVSYGYTLPITSVTRTNFVIGPSPTVAQTVWWMAVGV